VRPGLGSARAIVGNLPMREALTRVGPVYGQMFHDLDTGKVHWWNGTEWEQVEPTELPLSDRFRRAVIATAATQAGGGSTPGPRSVGSGPNGTGPGSDYSITNPILYVPPPVPPAPGGMDVPVLAGGGGDSNSQTIVSNSALGTPVVPSAVLCRPSSAQSNGAWVPVSWLAGGGSGGCAPFTPDLGPFVKVVGGVGFTGWQFTGSGSGNFSIWALFQSVVGPTVQSLRALLNGVVIATVSSAPTAGFNRYVNLTFTTIVQIGDALTFEAQSPVNVSGVTQQAGDPNTQITGGILYVP
jgi:hypothetical protein